MLDGTSRKNMPLTIVTIANIAPVKEPLVAADVGL